MRNRATCPVRSQPAVFNLQTKVHSTPCCPCLQHDLPWSPNMREAIGGLPPLPMDHPTNKYGWEERMMPAGGTRFYSMLSYLH